MTAGSRALGESAYSSTPSSSVTPSQEDRERAHREHLACPRGEHSWTDHLPGRVQSPEQMVVGPPGPVISPNMVRRALARVANAGPRRRKESAR